NFDAIKTIVEKTKKLAEKNNKYIKFAMVHNGTNWDSEKMEFFIENNIGVCFSLDGPEKLHDLHRPRCGGGGSHAEVVKWIKKFSERKYDGLHAIPVITKHSLPKWKEVVDEYLSLGIRKIRFKYLSYFGRAPHLWKELGYSPEEFFSSWKKMIEYLFELNQRGMMVTDDLTRVIAVKLFSEKDPGYCELHMPCGAGLSQLAYGPDGSVYTCDEGRMFEEFRIGHVDEPYTSVMNSPVLKSMAIASSGFFNSCDFCAYKPFCGVCPLESYNIQGRLNSNLAFDRRCKIHKRMFDYLFNRISEDPKFKTMLETWVRRDSKTESKQRPISKG
ncbi:MAG: SPASM domain-containing protein, partial [Candidatus Altiarchaeota archaeon]|nr:SPASM domain-containing protein [Candidatus Altiarchaeota archaeon]